MKLSTFLILSSSFALFQSGQAHDANDAEEEILDSQREGKYFPFLKLLEVPATPCGPNKVQDGVCVPRGKCTSLKGEKNGDCAKGFGECCQLKTNCNSTMDEILVTKEVIKITSANPINSSCSFTIKRKKDYCQVRLDFVEFMATNANEEGNCIQDYLAVRGSPTVRDGFRVCGNLRDQHMYLTFGKSGEIELIPSFLTQSGRYDIVVKQIPCISPRLVPSHCLQYFNETTDTITSFGYPEQQQNEQEYNVCIGANNNIASITYSPCPSTQNQPSFDIATPLDPADIINKPLVCQDRDFIQFFGRNIMCSATEFTQDIVVTRKPFIMAVNFNDVETQQLPCLDQIRAMNNPALCAIDNPQLMMCAGLPDGTGYFQTCVWSTDGVPSGQCICVPNPANSVIANLQMDSKNRGFCIRYVKSASRLG